MGFSNDVQPLAGRRNVVPQRSILIIDDHPATRRVLAAMLQGQGYAVDEVATTTECLALLDAGNTYDLLIIDIVMQEPGLQGLKLGQALKQRNPSQKLIYMSGFADMLPKEERERAGALVLAKPMRMSEFMENVRDALKSSD
jgi:DNA-binding NtrC family response regulator